MENTLKKTYGANNVITTPDYVFAKGNIPIMLIAHMDTVFEYGQREVFYDTQKNVMWSPNGAGFDDRAGIFGILMLLRKGYKPWVLFCNDEEVGGLGAEAAAKELQNTGVKDLKYIIELDRRGKNDCVFYGDDNDEFVLYVEKFGFKEAWGTFSDISEIAPQWGISAVNLSIGYEEEHTKTERLYVNHMFKTIERVENMLKDVDNIKPFKYVKSKNYSWYGYDYGFYDDDNSYSDALGLSSPEVEKFSYNGRTMVKCQHCNNWYDIDDAMPTIMSSGSYKYTCITCLGNDVDWCDMCGNPVEKDVIKTTPHGVCPICEEHIKAEVTNG